jgi:hypothetical protein
MTSPSHAPSPTPAGPDHPRPSPPRPGAPPLPVPSPLADRVAAVYQRESNRTLTVPEWGETEDTPLIIHYHPLTIAERDTLRLAADGRDDTATGTLDYLVRTILLKALGPDGAPLFRPQDRHILRHQAQEHIIRRVASVLLGETDPDALEILQAFTAPEGLPTLALFDIAATLSIPVTELRQRLTTEELSGWLAWLRIRGRL